MNPMTKIAVYTIMVGMLASSVSLAQGKDCPDYQDYLEWIPSATLPDWPTDVAVSGNHAYVTVRDLGLQVISLDNPAFPEVVGTTNSLSTANSIKVVGDLAYVLTWEEGLHIIDVSSPDAPSPVGSVMMTSWSWDVAVSGSYAYVGAENGAFEVVDVSNPADPVVVGTLMTPDPAQGVAVAGSFVYVADNSAGLQVVNVGDPENPFIAGSVGLPCCARKVAVSDGFAYVTVTGNGLQIVDISNPLTPLLVGSVVTPSPAWDVAVSGSYAFVACGETDPDLTTGSLEVINISTASAPFVEASLESINGLSRVALWGDYAITNPSVYDQELGQTVGTFAMAWIGCEPVSAVRIVPGVSTIPVLRQNVPNPFNPHTKITFDLMDRRRVSLQVYDLNGRMIRRLLNEVSFSAGPHEEFWNGRDDAGRQVASGTYLYRLSAGDFHETKRMVLVK
jgi:hypothetical protein